MAGGYTSDSSIKGFSPVIPYEIPFIALYEGRLHTLLWGFFIGISHYEISGVAFSPAG